MKKIFTGMMFLLTPCLALGMGASIEVQNIKMMPKGAVYLKIDQKTREASRVQSDTVFIEYALNGAKRRLWDDDGLATLFVYHRDISAKVFHGEMKLDSKLPMPKEPLILSLGRLAAEYESLKNYYEDRAKKEKDTDLSDEIANASEMLNRTLKVKDYVASNRFKEVSDLKASGLESLINDAESNHTYVAEIGEGKKKRNRMSFFIGKGIPDEIGEKMAPRCKDSIKMNWKDATRYFQVKEHQKGENSDDAAAGDGVDAN